MDANRSSANAARRVRMRRSWVGVIACHQWWWRAPSARGYRFTGTPENGTLARANGVLLVLRSSKAVHELAAEGAGRWRRTAPDPGFGAGVELGGGYPHGVGDLGGVRKALSGERLPAQQPPPALGQVQPRSEEHTSELQSRVDLVCRLLLEKKKKKEYRRMCWKKKKKKIKK